jgi:hypothetical protein
MKRFSSIEQFRNIYKNVEHWASRTGNPIPALRFKGTVKLHGTNAGLRRLIKNESVSYQCQTRNNVVNGKHYGFVEFIKKIPDAKKEELFSLAGLSNVPDSTIFGEWVGSGIQKGVGVSTLDKHWVIFQTASGEEYTGNNRSARLEEFGIYNIEDVPSYDLIVDFKEPEHAMKIMEELTLGVEKECPWARKFGVSGIGEGIVWTCPERANDSDLWFKTKGDKHSVSKVKKVVSIDPEKVKTIREAISNLLTESRLRQGLEFLRESNLEAEIKNIGIFLKYVNTELLREEEDTLKESKIDMKAFWKMAARTAKDFYLVESKRI